MKRFGVLLIWLYLVWPAAGQAGKPLYDKYLTAVDLFDTHHYTLAKEHFLQLKADPRTAYLAPDIDYYLTRLAVLSDPHEALREIDAYLVRYPSSPYRQKLLVAAADYYFTHGRYDQVKSLIDNMAVYDLPKADRRRMLFYRGFIALKENRTKEAKKYFKELEDDPVWGDQAKYYLGYLAFLKNNVVEARRYFSQVNPQSPLAAKIPYYNAIMNYRAGLFEDAVREGLKIYPRLKRDEKSEMAKIIGSSYFNLKQYDKAIPYLEAYRGKKGRKTNTDYYELGYAYYQAGRCDKAVDYFNKIIGEDTPLARNAYYHLAKCYLRNGDKAKALNALKKVSEMPFDDSLQEEALYNYIKLSYEIGNPYEPVGDAVERYKQKYPRSPRIKELEDLMINAYLTSHRFADAVEAMQRAGMQDRPEYQLAAYYRGIELFNDGRYEDALKMFDESIRHGKDLDYRNKALFWKAESLYRLGRYQDALLAYKEFEVNNRDKHSYEAQLLPYNLGYVYFKLKKYPQAAEYFKKFVSTATDDKLLKDAYIRLGDSYFAAKKYWPAMEAYNEAIKRPGPGADYAFYQKAVSYGFVGRDDRKIAELRKFIERYPRSPLMDDALYQLGSTYLNKGRTADARRAFDRLVEAYPSSPYVPVALLKAGLAMYNAGRNDEAIAYFQKLIRRYPQTPEAREAAGYLKRIYIDQNRVDDYLAFINSVKGFEGETSSLEKDIFDAAEQKYFFKDYDGARRALESYLQRFPDGAYNVKAHAYLARIYAHEGQKDQAARHYEWLVNQGRNNYITEALHYLIDYAKAAGDDARTIHWLESLEQYAQTGDDTYRALTGLMTLYDKTGNREKAAEYARRVLEHPKATDADRNRARLILARRAWQAHDTLTARRYYEELAGQATGRTAAEALYYKALFQHLDGQYDASNKTIGTLTEKYPSYKYWGAKALVVMARNMYAKGDVFNATYILENVIKRFPQYPDVVEEAQRLLDRIKAEQQSGNR